MTAYFPGDIDIETFIITSPRGDIDLVNDRKATLLDFNIYESALDYHTFADVKIFDPNDVLGENNLSGDETVEISFKAPGNNSTASFKFSILQNANMEHTGSMKGKVYELRLCSPEMLHTRNKSINKSYNDLTSAIVEDVVKNYWDTEKDIEVKQPTKGKQRFIGNSNSPYKVIDLLKSRHVSSNYQKDGSAYSLFETRNDSGEQVIRFTTFYDMMETDCNIGFTYLQDPTIRTRTLTTSDDYKNIINLKIPSSFYTPFRWSSTSAQSSYNVASGKQQKEDRPFNDFSLPTSESNISSAQKSKINSPSKNKKPQRHVVVSPDNDPQSTYITQMKPYKAAMMARLSNDAGIMEVNGNADLKVGHYINIKLPKKADSSAGEMEKQITDKVLITRLRHKIKPAGQRPRYTTVVEFIKAGFDQGVS